MKYYSGILLSSLLIGTSLATDPTLMEVVTADAAFIAAHSGEEAFWGGLVLGIQQDPTNTAHACYGSFNDVIKQIGQVNTFIADLAAKTAANQNTGNSVVQNIASNIWQMPGTYFTIGKQYMQVVNVFMSLYSSCYLDDMVITTGLTINSISGACNFIVTSFMWLLNNMDTDPAAKNELMGMYKAQSDWATADTNAGNTLTADQVAAAKLAAVKDFSISFAAVAKKTLNIQVPDATKTYS